MKQPLVSVIILSYKNYHYIFEALNSVIYQDYNNLEIIVSNDGSNDFDQRTTAKYIEKNKGKNIKKYIVNNNSINLGTVKNINKAIKLSHGDYIIIFAADDVMYNSRVISQFIDAFQTLSNKELIVTSQVGMFDLRLRRLIQLFISEENKVAIQKLTPRKLFGEMSIRCILPGSGTCYKRQIFNKYKIFDERYTLVEDYSSALRLSRLGVRYNFFDFISFKHRDGGISHGNILGDISAGEKYNLDIVNILKHEILPHLKLLNRKQQKSFWRLYRAYRWEYLYNYKYKTGTKAERRKFVSANLNTITYSFFNKIFTEILDQIKGKKFLIFIFGIFLLTVYSFKVDYGSAIFLIFGTGQSSVWSNNFNRAIGFIGLVSTVSCISLTIYVFIKKYIYQVYRFIKFIF